MHSAIVVVTKPDALEDGASLKWMDFMADVNRQCEMPDPLRNHPGVAPLAENVWQVNFQESPSSLARLVDCAVRHKFPYGILQLDASPQWLPVGFEPNPS